MTPSQVAEVCVQPAPEYEKTHPEGLPVVMSAAPELSHSSCYHDGLIVITREPKIITPIPRNQPSPSAYQTNTTMGKPQGSSDALVGNALFGKANARKKKPLADITSKYPDLHNQRSGSSVWSRAVNENDKRETRTTMLSNNKDALLQRSIRVHQGIASIEASQEGKPTLAKSVWPPQTSEVLCMIAEMLCDCSGRRCCPSRVMNTEAQKSDKQEVSATALGLKHFRPGSEHTIF